MSNVDENILDRFNSHQEKFKEEIRKSADLIDKQVVISSPANKWIVYKLETAFDIIILHEKRHLKQTQAILEQQK